MEEHMSEGTGTMSERTESIATELLALRNGNGVINPAEAVSWAKTHRKSSLHGALEWDDEIAGEKWRIWQVRQMISVYIVDADGGRRFVSLSIDRKHDGSNGYRPLSEVMERPDLREVMMNDALHDLERVQERYKKLTDLNEVWAAAEKLRARRRTKTAA
jgi:hypothetical protein